MINLITVSNYLTINDIKILSVNSEKVVKDSKKSDFIYCEQLYD